MMDYDPSEEREWVIHNNIEELQEIDDLIKELRTRKAYVVEELLAALGHLPETEEKYRYKDYSITAKSFSRYVLNKAAYEEANLPKAIDPVNKEIIYRINRQFYEEQLNRVPEKWKEKLEQIIVKKPTKPKVIIKKVGESDE